MLKTRVIPCLLLRNTGLVKTVRFKNPSYVGDPVNTVRIYNEKEVDEIIFLDITATADNRPPNIPLLRQIASECFMPLAYGGGITSVEHAAGLFTAGAEKVAVNSAAVERPGLITEIAKRFGSQSIIASIDVKKTLFGRSEARVRSGSKSTGADAATYARRMQDEGAGEILLTSIDRDGTFEGYDIDLIRSVTAAVSIPVIACGGARNVNDFREAVEKGGASAVAAGSMVVYQGAHRAVLINFPRKSELKAVLN